jgi:uncharacterized Zn finger protein
VFDVPTGQTDMKCPNCQNREFDVYEARGFTSKESPIKECECGHVWRLIPLVGGNKRIDTIKQGNYSNTPRRVSATKQN